MSGGGQREGERERGRETGGGAVHQGVAQQSLHGEPRPNVQPFTPLYITILTKKVALFVYSLTSPYGHLSIKNSSFGLRNSKNHPSLPL